MDDVFANDFRRCRGAKMQPAGCLVQVMPRARFHLAALVRRANGARRMRRRIAGRKTVLKALIHLFLFVLRFRVGAQTLLFHGAGLSSMRDRIATECQRPCSLSRPPDPLACLAFDLKSRGLREYVFSLAFEFGLAAREFAKFIDRFACAPLERSSFVALLVLLNLFAASLRFEHVFSLRP